VNRSSKLILTLYLALATSSLIWSGEAIPSAADGDYGGQSLFSDNFSNGLGKWNSVQGKWIIDGGHLQGDSETAPSMISAGDAAWNDYILTAHFIGISTKTIVVYVRWVDAQNHYRIVLAGDHFEFWLKKSGSDQLLFRERSWGYPLSMTSWHQIRIRIYGAVPTIAAYLDGTPEITIKDLSSKSIPTGMIALGVDSDSSTAFDDISVTTLHPDAYGPHSIILLLVEFPDVKHSLTPEQLQGDVFNTLNKYYTEVSYNQTWITGAVTPEWKMLPQPATYYDLATVTTSGWGKGRAEEIIQDAIKVWDGQVHFKQYDDVFIATAGDATWSYEDRGFGFSTNDNLTVTQAVVMGRLGSRDGWKVAAHELGHIFGLPDLYSYPIAYSGPADWREAAVYVGPWDLMSRSDERPQIGAWGKTKLGWLSPAQVFEILPSQVGAATVEPLENPTSGIQAIMIYLTSTTYFIIENRQPIGFDTVLPDKGILISYVDETRYWRGTGPVFVQDANPGTAPRWQLQHPTFNTTSTGKALFTNQTYNVATLLLDRIDDSYLVAAGTSDSVNAAKTSYDQAKVLIQKAENLLKDSTSYKNPDAITAVTQARERNDLARQALLNQTHDPFKAAVKFANDSVTLLNEARQLELRQESNALPSQGPLVWITAVVALGAVVTVGVWVFVRKRRGRS
jgi:M6 family metalloprotease-like protein